MKYLSIIFSCLIFSLLVRKAYAQCGIPMTAFCNPATTDISLDTPINVDMTFDSFSEYNGGITINGSSIVRLKVFDNPASTCNWKLKMIVLNNGIPAANEWDRTATYGVGAGADPLLSLLQVRVTNGCGNTTMNGVWRSFPALAGSSLDIINSAVNTPAGTCDPLLQTNGAGTHLANYNEYSFTVDYRLVPGFTYIPGRYELSIKFCLTE